MSTVTDAIATVAGAAASANPISALAALGEKLLSFIPDPAQKAAAQQHVLDAQQQLALAQIDQQTKLAQQAGQNIQNDKLSGPRATFCYAVIMGIVWNLVLCPFFHQTPQGIPVELVVAFTALMLGQAGVQAAQNVALAPGDSQTSLFGFKLGNKS